MVKDKPTNATGTITSARFELDHFACLWCFEVRELRGAVASRTHEHHGVGAHTPLPRAWRQSVKGYNNA